MGLNPQCAQVCLGKRSLFGVTVLSKLANYCDESVLCLHAKFLVAFVYFLISS